ncbi:MAG: sulfite exporter TauE/SafE family protein [Phycisphaera sp.]|nr:MAG: sulfite exporter TauE/SafE family protein [Phycisphaera sp.]
MTTKRAGRDRAIQHLPFVAWAFWFLCAWAFAVVYLGLGPTVAREWPIAVAMAAGSYVAGSTPMGGGTVGFPILVLLFDEPVSLGRNFSFLIQSVGMTSATIFILCGRLPLAVRPMLWSMAAAVVVVPVASALVVPMLGDGFIKLVFAVIWAGFGIMTLVKLRQLLTPHPMIARSARFDAVVGMIVGAVGGLAASATGVGIDMVLYCVLVLVYRADLRTAVASSVIVMAFTSVIGALNAASLGQIDPPVLAKWLAAAPIVLLGAPLGVLMMRLIPRSVTLVVVSLLCLGQFFWALGDVGLSLYTVGGSVLAVLALNACFHVMYSMSGPADSAETPAPNSA